MSTSGALEPSPLDSSYRATVAPSPPPNVAADERWISALAGGGLVLAGLGRQSIGGLALAAVGGSLVYRGFSGHCMVYEALGVNRAGFANPALGVRAQHGYRHEKTLLIDRSPEELYRFWRRLENLPQVMQHLVSVSEDGTGCSHWVARVPGFGEISWDAEMINDRENELIAWRSVPGSELDTAGSVHFRRAPGDRGTFLDVSLKYDPPGGKVGATIASLFGSGFGRIMDADLHELKRRLESAESPTAGPSI